MQFSKFGEKLAGNTGIFQLMDDFAASLSSEQPMQMLGGGNPSHIPEVLEYFRQSLLTLINDPQRFAAFLGNYDAPQGNLEFISALATMLKEQCGWDITEENITLTNGSQNAFFFLFNLLAGEMPDGQHKKILLPLTPEYIGYTDVGLSDNLFATEKPVIEMIDRRTFKYGINFDKLNVTDDIGAICVSRPTNPTGNVLTDDEIAHLDRLANMHNIPLIIDNAYGAPFPKIISTDIQPHWNKNTITCMSLSKLGLPAARTGIIIADKPIVKAISAMSAIVNLSPGGLGASLATEMVRTGEILAISDQIVQPYYAQKAEQAMQWFDEAMGDAEGYIHKPEGAIFLWLWFKGLPISSQELYERLKRRGGLVCPGHYFFPGIDEDWQHKHECIRITYSQSDDDVRTGIGKIAEEVKRAYREAKE